MTIVRLPGAGGSQSPHQFPRRRVFQLGAGAMLGALNVGPGKLVPQQRGPWLVFVSEHRADRGFVVEDERQAQFASAYGNLGGSAVAGPAISSRFREEPGGPVCQVFARLALHASTGARPLRPAPLLTMASDRGFDDFLQHQHGIPPPLTGRAATGLAVDGEFAAAYDGLGGWPVLGAPTTTPMRVEEAAVQRFENGVIAVREQSGEPQSAELAPVPLYLQAAGYFPGIPFLPRALPVYPMEAPPVVRHGDPTQPYVFITVDDCWDPDLTARCLDIARDERIKITFFPVGAQLSQDPALWRRAIIEGHSIENHTQWHLPLPELSDARIRWELDEAGRQLNAALGYEYRQRFLRPPEGAGIPGARSRLVRITQAAGLHIAMWTADSKGWLRPWDDSARAQEFVFGNLSDHLTPGAILLLHALESDLAALPRLTREIHSVGLQSVNLRDQLHLPGAKVPADHPLSSCPEALPDAAAWC